MDIHEICPRLCVPTGGQLHKKKNPRVPRLSRCAMHSNAGISIFYPSYSVINLCRSVAVFHSCTPRWFFFLGGHLHPSSFPPCVFFNLRTPSCKVSYRRSRPCCLEGHATPSNPPSKISNTNEMSDNTAIDKSVLFRNNGNTGVYFHSYQASIPKTALCEPV